jgi:hypothetical protein
MRKFLVVAALLAVVAIPAAGLSATLDTTKFTDLINAGDACEDGAFYHFVNNQTGGAAAGTLTATFNVGAPIVTGPYALSGPHVQHFSVFSEAKLTGASTGALPGKLVLSDVTCAKKD